MITPTSTPREIFLEAVQSGLESPDASIEALLAVCESELKSRDKTDGVPFAWYIGYIVGSASKLLSEKSQFPFQS